MDLGKTIVQFTKDDVTVEIDIVDGQLKIESFAVAREGDSALILSDIRDWFEEEFGLKITTTDAWQIQSTLDYQFADLKKKLSRRLVSHSGMGSTPLNSRPLYSRCLRFFSPSFWRRGKSRTDSDAVISRLIESGAL